MNTYNEEIKSIHRLVEFYEDFETQLNDYINKLQVIIAESMIGDNDVIWEYIQNHMCERMESQIVVAAEVLEEVTCEREFFDNLLKGNGTQGHIL